MILVLDRKKHFDSICAIARVFNFKVKRCGHQVFGVFDEGQLMLLRRFLVIFLGSQKS